jgi:hypothetical protein
MQSVLKLSRTTSLAATITNSYSPSAALFEMTGDGGTRDEAFRSIVPLVLVGCSRCDRSFALVTPIREHTTK